MDREVERLKNNKAKWKLGSGGLFGFHFFFFISKISIEALKFDRTVNFFE